MFKNNVLTSKIPDFFFRIEILLRLGVPDNQILLHFSVPNNQILLRFGVPDKQILFHFGVPRQLLNEYILLAMPGPLEQLAGTPKWSKIWLSGTPKQCKIWLSGTPKWSKIWLSGEIQMD